MKKIMILLMGLLLIGANVYAGNGDLVVQGKVGIGGPNTTGAQLLLQEKTGNGPAIRLANELSNVQIFTFAGGQSDHLSTIPGAGYNYYLFENSNAGKNKEFRVYGYPAGAGGASYGSLQVTGTNADFEIKTGNSSTNILLMPGDSAGVGIGTANPQSKLAVSGLPTTKPEDGSAMPGGIVCITGNGNMWIDTDSADGICN